MPDASTLLADLARARQTIIEAELSTAIAERYLSAHLAAQQVAAVVLAARAARLRGGPTDTWSALAQAAPECGEWAAYFAATQPKRQAVAAGARAIVSEREADDMVRDAQGFHDLVARQVRRCASGGFDSLRSLSRRGGGGSLGRREGGGSLGRREDGGSLSRREDGGSLSRREGGDWLSRRPEEARGA